MNFIKKLFIYIVLLKVKAAILILAFSVFLFSQEDEIHYTHLTTEDGLSLNTVTQILQDSRGFLWFGTHNGLNRYDGYNFKVFQPNASDPKSISNHSIWSLYEDSKGYIWIGTAYGLDRYNWKTEEFRKYFNDPKNPKSISDNLVYSISEDKTGTLWVSTDNGLNKYNRETDNFTEYKGVNAGTNINSHKTIFCSEEDYKGNIWLGTRKGLICIQKNGEIKNITLPGIKNLESDFYNEISAILEDNDKNLWVGTNGKGLYKYNPNTGKFISYLSIPAKAGTISDNSVSVVYQDRHNFIWVGTKNGLNRFDPKSNNFTRIFHDPLKPLSLVNSKIYSITEDKTGIIWVGTDGGTSRFLQPYSRFKYFNENKNSADIIGNQYITSLFIDKDKNLWVGAKKGLYQIKNILSRINNSSDPLYKNMLTDDYIWSVIEDHFGIIWMGSDRGGLYSYDPVLKQFRVYRTNDSEESISNNGVISVYEDRHGNIWAGTWSGFNLFDRKTNKFKRFINIFKNNVIWVFYEDSKGMLWIGTDGSGVGRYNPEDKSFANFSHDSLGINNISGNRVISIYETADGIMWFGTLEGLNSYDRNTSKFTNYLVKDGLQSNIINGVEEDNKGFLWIATDKGLSKFNRKTGIFVNYSKRNGLKDSEFSPRAFVKTSDGDFIYGTKNGLTFFNPDSINNENFTSSVVFTDFKVYNQSVPITSNGILTESITTAKLIRIPFGEDVITFEFALLDFYDVKNNTFQFKLEGFDKDWNNVGKRNNATYTNLLPGNYKFIVRALNNNNVNNIKEASIQVVVVPEFYQTWWFRIAFGLGVIFSALFIIQSKTRSIKRHNKQLEIKVSERTKDLDNTINELSQEIVERKKAEERAKASLEEKESLLGEKEVLLKEIHHRVKNNLQVISSLLYLNSRKIKDPDALNMFKESQNRVKSIALVHERLYRSKDLARIDFHDYVQQLTKDLFRSYAVDQSVVKLELNINDVLINIDTAVPCGLIINELISNSLKYAFPNYEEEKKQGVIKVDFNRCETGELLLLVSDDGIGMPRELDEKKKQSLGLQLVETLVTQLEGTIEYTPGIGTMYKIVLKSL